MRFDNSRESDNIEDRRGAGGGLPIGGVTQFDLPNSHLQYAITWYGLALALAGVVAYAVIRRKT